MKIIELILDEENEDNGVSALSLVENPAIEETWVALKSDEVKLAEIDKEKRLLLGAALTPNRPIYRKGLEGTEDYYIFFSKDTVRKASQLFFKKGNQNNATLEHNVDLEGLTVVESWIVEDSKTDKSALYGMELPEGTWAVSMKVNSDEVWNEYVKKGKVKGFSIEAFFTDKMERPKDKTIKEEAEASALVKQISKLLQNEA